MLVVTRGPVTAILLLAAFLLGRIVQFLAHFGWTYVG